MTATDLTSSVAALAARYTGEMTTFLRDMIAIPSESAGERDVVARVADEMRRVGFDEVKIDGLGNVLGRVGSGPTVIAIDGHLDTVGVGDRSTWTRDPYVGELRDGIVFGRGASDQEAGIAAAVHGARIAKELGLLEGVQLWVTGTVMEEDCDGLCWQYILKEGVLEPEVVVITEPTNLGVYRGHRGRMEMEVRTQGLSCHGSAPERGVNAVYKMASIIADIERLNEALAVDADPFLGKGSVTISEIRSTSPSLCAVADSCTIHLDRRLTRGETLERRGPPDPGTRERQAGGRDGHRARLRPRGVHRAHLSDEEVLPDVGRGRRDAGRARCGRRRDACARASAGCRQVDVLDQRHCDLRDVRRADGRLRPRQRGPRPHAGGSVPVEHLTLAAQFYALFAGEYLKAQGSGLRAEQAGGARPAAGDID